MGLPASLPTEPLFGFAVEPAGWRELQEEGASLVDEVRRTKPADRSPEESVALAGLARFGLRSFKVLGVAFLDVVRGQLQAALTAIVEKEIGSAEAQRMLALRHIQLALHRYGVVLEGVWTSLANVPASAVDQLIASWDESIDAGVALMIDDERIVARFQLDVLVAITVLDAPLEELTFWAFRAITGARRVEALGDRAAETRRLGERARARTRNAWTEWSSQDVVSEVAPWNRS